MTDLITHIGGRRFLMCLLVGATATVLCWFMKISGAEWVTVTIATVGAYIAGNVTQKVKGAPDA